MLAVAHMTTAGCCELSDADAAAVMDRHPGRAAGVGMSSALSSRQSRHDGHRSRRAWPSVLAVGAGDRAVIQVIAAIRSALVSPRAPSVERPARSVSGHQAAPIRFAPARPWKLDALPRARVRAMMQVRVIWASMRVPSLRCGRCPRGRPRHGRQTNCPLSGGRTAACTVLGARKPGKANASCRRRRGAPVDVIARIYTANLRLWKPSIASTLGAPSRLRLLRHLRGGLDTRRPSHFSSVQPCGNKPVDGVVLP